MAGAQQSCSTTCLQLACCCSFKHRWLQTFEHIMYRCVLCHHHIQRQPDILLQGINSAGAHTDYGLLTVLADDNPGLQIFTEGKWAHVRPVPGTFSINLGDMLERCGAAAAVVVAANALCDCSCYLNCSVVTCTLHPHACNLSTASHTQEDRSQANIPLQQPK